MVPHHTYLGVCKCLGHPDYAFIAVYYGCTVCHKGDQKLFIPRDNKPVMQTNKNLKVVTRVEGTEETGSQALSLIAHQIK